MILAVIIIVGAFFFLLVAFLVIVSILSWNIPITILRFTGNKQRPMVIHKKGKKQLIKGVPHLRVRGYKETIRDFKSEYYYPAHKSKYGALILWEFEDGWLTPAIPAKKKFDAGEWEAVSQSLEVLQKVAGVSFDYDPETHHLLKLKVVDDVDTEFLVEQLAREDRQYSGGFWAFMERYGNHVTVIFIVVCLLVGFIIYLQKAPNLGAQCLNNLREVAQSSFIERMADAAVPKG